MPRGRLVCTNNNSRIQKRLLAEKALTYIKARELALSMESAVQGSRDIQSSSSETVQKVAEVMPSSYTKYLRCGRTNHKASKC